MAKKPLIDNETLITSPGAHFKSVRELLDSDDLNREQKHEALKNWQYYCQQISTSAAEGMIREDKPKEETPNACMDVEEALRQFQ